MAEEDEVLWPHRLKKTPLKMTDTDREGWKASGEGADLRIPGSMI